ncbi:TolC family protein [Roseateles chitinivorans]|uniref:TolC family protein n=1 Tax=Roseateles chitinivorans TaxID=2917965 RepID=UPI003D67D5BE
MSILLGKQPGAVDSELRPAGTIPSAPDLPAELSPADLLRRRPDVVAAERHLAASSELIGAAIAEYYPKLSLSLSGGFDTVAGGRLFDSDSAQHIGAAGFRWRLFDFGRIDAEVRRAKGANVEALALYRKAILKAVEDVENAVTAFNEGQQRVDHVRLQVAALDRAQHLAEESYKLGAVSLIEVVDAQRQLLASRIILHQSSADASRSAVALYRAVGGGWK